MKLTYLSGGALQESSAAIAEAVTVDVELRRAENALQILAGQLRKLKRKVWDLGAKSTYLPEKQRGTLLNGTSPPGLATKCWMRYGQKWQTSFKMPKTGQSLSGGGGGW